MFKLINEKIVNDYINLFISESNGTNTESINLNKESICFNNDPIRMNPSQTKVEEIDCFDVLNEHDEENEKNR